MNTIKEYLKTFWDSLMGPRSWGTVTQNDLLKREGIVSPLVDQYKPQPTSTAVPTTTPTTKPTITPTATPTQEYVSPLPQNPELTATPTPPKTITAGRIPVMQTMKISPEVISAINDASAEFNVPAELLFDIAFSESSLGPLTPGPTDDLGLFQFQTETWKDVGKYASNPKSPLKNFNPDPRARLDPRMSARAAAYLISRGQLSRWNSSKDVEGKWGTYWTPEELKPYYSQSRGR